MHTYTYQYEKVTVEGKTEIGRGSFLFLSSHRVYTRELYSRLFSLSITQALERRRKSFPHSIKDSGYSAHIDTSFRTGKNSFRRQTTKMKISLRRKEIRAKSLSSEMSTRRKTSTRNPIHRDFISVLVTTSFVINNGLLVELSILELRFTRWTRDRSKLIKD